MNSVAAGCAVYVLAAWQTVTRVPSLLTRPRRRGICEAAAGMRPADSGAADRFDDLPVSCMCCDGPASCDGDGGSR